MTRLQLALTELVALSWLSGVFTVLSWQSLARWWGRGNDNEWPM